MVCGILERGRSRATRALPGAERRLVAAQDRREPHPPRSPQDVREPRRHGARGGVPRELQDERDVAEDCYTVRDFDTVPGIFHADELFEGIDDARLPERSG